MTWTYNALCNVASMETMFGLRLSHAAKIKKWASWGSLKREEVLEALRTGGKTLGVKQELTSWSTRTLFSVDTQGGQRMADVKWDNVYTALQRIASTYDLTASEFEYYCCGEPGMDALRMIYWMAHRVCATIQRVKHDRPAASQEEVAFHILDRWGLPIVPWTCNIFNASFCKDQDHGIAMLFGLSQPDGEEFDPVQHFDLARCTIRMDSQATNMLMKDYSTDS
ncbi:hypothetical protein C8A01DRAFT_31500 [Parachaetomium inaequale]|uniref:Uncharacterized protein n=1 Tax=Parachaetomium inaequale TaxID=2588326 RepID=A0AAN6PT99_9PEZI|nr:hypothetical protein C8A01DRAFT_31500 [Parachaetomium inaequale]